MADDIRISEDLGRQLIADGRWLFEQPIKVWIACFSLRFNDDHSNIEVVEERRNQLQPRWIDKDQFTAAVFQSVLKFWPFPPGIHWHNDCTKYGSCHICKTPFRRIACANSNTITETDMVVFF